MENISGSGLGKIFGRLIPKGIRNRIANLRHKREERTTRATLTPLWTGFESSEDSGTSEVSNAPRVSSSASDNTSKSGSARASMFFKRAGSALVSAVSHEKSEEDLEDLERIIGGSFGIDMRKKGK